MKTLVRKLTDSRPLYRGSATAMLIITRPWDILEIHYEYDEEGLGRTIWKLREEVVQENEGCQAF